MRCIAALFVACLAVGLTARLAHADPILELSISEAGYSTVYFTSTPGNTIDETLNYGSYVNATNSGLSISVYGDDSGISFSVQVAKTTAAYSPITIALTETGLPAGPGAVMDFQSYTTANLRTASSLTLATYYNPDDALFGTEDLISARKITGPFSSSSNVTDDVVRLAEPFSITKIATLTPTSGSFPTFDPQLYVTVPEPASLVLLVMGVIPLPWLRRRCGNAASA